MSTRGEIDLVDLTEGIRGVVSRSRVRDGLAHVFAPHSTGIIILTEYEPNLLDDIKRLLEGLAPKHAPYNHPNNAHSHLRSILLPPDRTLPVVDGSLVLGTWQSIVFVETDVRPRHRTVIAQVIGE
ncbi:MAG: secondary thiamine-phosphate synthase enzyme YjbQ [Candidatus Bathyarchaeia archaeon]